MSRKQRSLYSQRITKRTGDADCREDILCIVWRHHLSVSSESHLPLLPSAEVKGPHHHCPALPSLDSCWRQVSGQISGVKDRLLHKLI